MSPTVSVIVPTFNRAGTVTRAIDSVLAQTFGDFELLVVDDASTDDTEAVIDTYGDDRIEYLRLAENRGANAARNRGIELASGDYVAFLDADDEWKPAKLQRQVETFETAPDDVALVYIGTENRGPDGEVIGRSTPDRNGDLTRDLLLGNFIGSFSAVAVRRAVFGDVHLNEDLPSWQDWEFYIRLSRNWSFRAVPEPLTVKHSDAANQISGNYERKQTVSFPVLRDLATRIADSEGLVFGRRVRATLTFQLGYAALCNAEYGDAREHLLRSVAWYPLQARRYLYLIAALGGGRLYTLGVSLKRRFLAP